MAISIGDINFGLGADTAGLKRAIDRLNDFSKQVDQTARQVQNANDAQIKAFARQESAVRSALQQVLRLNQQIRQAGAPPELIARNTKAFQRLTTEMTRGEASALQFNRSIDRFRGQLGKSRRGLLDFSKNTQGAGDKTHRLAILMRDLESASVLAIGPLSGLGARIRALSSITSRSSLALAGFLSALTATTLGVALLLRESVQTGRRMQGIENALRAATGASTLAEKEFEFLRETSEDLGLQVESTASSYARLLSSAAPTANTFEEIRSAFLGLSQAASVFDLSAAETEGTMRALEDIVGKGVVSMEELRRQLATKIPGVIPLVAQQLGEMGVLVEGTSAELNKLVASGELASDVFIRAFGPALQEAFSEDAVRAAQDMESSINNLRNSVFAFARAFDQAAKVSKAFQQSLDALAAGFRGMADNLEVALGLVGALGGAALGLLVARMGLLTRALTALRAALLAVNIQATIQGFLSLGAAAGVARRGILGLVAALSALLGARTVLGMITRLGIVVGAAVGGYKALSGAAQQASDSQQALLDDVDNLIGVYEELDRASAKTARALRASLELELAGITLQIDTVRQEFGRLAEEVRARTSRAVSLLGPEALTLEVRGTDDLLEADKRLKGLLETQDGLFQRLQILEDMLRGFNDAVGGMSEPTKEAQDALKELVAELKTLEAAQSAISRGGASVGMVQGILDLAEAQKALADVPIGEQQVLRDTLAAAGFTAGNVTQAYAALIARTRTLGDSVKDFLREASKAPETLREVSRETAILRQQLDALRRGPEALEQFEKAQDIQQELIKLQNSLQPLVDNRLLSEERMNALLSERENLLKAIQELEGQEEAIKAQKEMAKAFGEATREIERLRASAQAMAAGPEVFEQFEILAEHTDKIRSFREALEEAEVAQADVNRLTREFSEALRASEAERQRMERFKGIAQEVRESVERSFDHITEAITDSFVKGEAAAIDFRNVMLAVINEIISSLIQAVIVSQLVNAITGGISSFLGGGAAPAAPSGGAGSAGAPQLMMARQGQAFSGGAPIKAFAKGGILDSPTIFPFRDGIGLAGEAGTEAILPLARKGGRLGVEASGVGGGDVLINIIDRRTGDSPDIQVNERRGPGGQRQIDIMVGQSFRRQFREGAFTRDFQEVLGLVRKSSR